MKKWKKWFNGSELKYLTCSFPVSIKKINSWSKFFSRILKCCEFLNEATITFFKALEEDLKKEKMSLAFLVVEQHFCRWCFFRSWNFKLRCPAVVYFGTTFVFKWPPSIIIWKWLLSLWLWYVYFFPKTKTSAKFKTF